ncbi:MAG TPA: hypothetical protein ENI62_12020 [Gammaproteobacteria bacterium]|nr:hypothetical protein [Gammaproteobacteria bacterium]
MTSIHSLIDQNAVKRKEKTFLIAPETNQLMSYRQLQAHVRDIARLLDNIGVQRQDKAAFLLPNGYWTTVLFLGVMYSGRIVVPLNAIAGDSALSFVIEHSDCKILFVSAEYRQKYASTLNSLPNTIELIDVDVDNGLCGENFLKACTHRFNNVPVADQDNAILIYTSGTTGQPKGVLLSHGNIVAGGENTVGAHDLTSTDRTLCVLPLYHINAEIVSVIAPLVSGGSIVIPHRFSVSTFWKAVARHSCTWFSVVPTMIAYLLEHAEREGFDRQQYGGLETLRFGRSASAPLAPEMHKAFEELFGIPVVETMGLTETAAQILANPMPPKAPRYGSPGQAYGNEVRILDENKQPCSPGVTGELMVRGANVTTGYYKNPEATTMALEPDGWLHTGDMARCDKDGFFFITGRYKELIIKGGENIAPREIDEALYEHPAVLEAAGFGIPDAKYGQEVMACVTTKPGTSCTEIELSEYVVRKLGTYKSPKRIFFMDALPKGPSGKIQRLKLPALIQSYQTTT